MSTANTPSLPLVFLIGGPDINARLELMRKLRSDFRLAAVGSNPSLQSLFRSAGFDYFYYHLKRNANPLTDLSVFLTLYRLFLQHRPQLVHAYDTKPCVFARLAARLAGIPVVIGTLPGLGWLYSNNGLSSRLILAIYQPLQKLASHLSDLTTFQLESDLNQFIKLGITPKNKTQLIPGSGVNNSTFDPTRFAIEQRQQLRKELGIPIEAVVVTMVSRLIRSKGVLDFAAAANLLRQNINVFFILAGSVDDGSLDHLSFEEIEFIKQSVKWLGDRSDIPNLLAISDIFAFPTSYAEGLPRALLEAAASALPIIASDIPGCRAVIKNGENGLITPVHKPTSLAQAILTLSENPSTRKYLGQAARQRAISEFDISVIYKQTRQIYRELLDSKIH